MSGSNYSEKIVATFTHLNYLMATKIPAVLANSEIKPYASFTLYTCADASLKTVTAKIAKLEELAQASIKGKMRVASVTTQWIKKKTTAKAFILREVRQAAWSLSASVKDTVHHLVLLLHYDGHLGVVVSDSATRTVITSAIESSNSFQKFEELALENAFVNDTVLRALWLRGAHRKNERKADSKVLFGPRLQSALNPMDDRSFQSSSVRSEALSPTGGGKQRVIGVTPSSSYLWLGPTKDVSELISHFTQIISHLKSKGATTGLGIPFLAKPVTIEPKPGEISVAFDFSFIEADSPNLDSADALLLERWQQELSITTVAGAGSKFELSILDINSTGTWAIQIDVSQWTKRLKVAFVALPGTEKWKQLDAVLGMLSKFATWSVWFESGHALVEGKLTRSEIVIADFEHARDANFGSYNIEVEKPVIHDAAGLATNSIDFSKIGDGSDLSLCSWWLLQGAVQMYPGLSAIANDEFVHMICDDGAGEAADFILFAKHKIFQTPTNPSKLAVIQVHLKAAGKLNKTPTATGQPRKRGMAPKKFEEVLQQAVKNLSVVRMPALAEKFSKALKDGVNPLWTLNGSVFTNTLAYKIKLSASSQVLADLSNFNGQRYHKHVVVVQPHQSMKEFNDEMAKPYPKAKMQLLCTLLNHADAACRSDGAKFECVFRS